MLELRIAKPCGESWSAMDGEGAVRHCRRCDHAVYDTSRMTEAEIEALIRQTEGRFCARVYRRADGRMMTADCPRPEPKIRRKRVLAVSVVFGLATMISSGCMGSTGSPPEPEQPATSKTVEPSALPNR